MRRGSGSGWSQLILLIDASDEEKEDVDPLTDLNDTLSELTTSHDIVQRRHQELIRAVNDFDAGKDKHAVKLKERVAMFKITADAMSKVRECVCVHVRSCIS